MSIASSIFAENANEVKTEWVRKLREAKNMEEIKVVIDEIDEDNFTE